VRTGRAAFALAAALATPGSAAEPVALGPCGPIDRLHEPIEIEAARLVRLGGTPLAHLGVLAFRDGKPAPIPFQVDERAGRKLVLPDGPEPTTDDRPGVLDPNDLLVFMACDAGEQAGADAVERALADAGPVAAWRELRIEDPRGGRSGFAYVVAAERPPATDRRYVAYQPGVDIVTTAAYRIGLVQALPNYFALALDGPLGPNLLDGLRLRAEATLRANLAHWTLNERQGHHELVAWKAGPVRVVRRSRHQVTLGLGIRLTAGIAHTFFYPRHVFGPGSLKLPFSPSIFFRDITALGGADARDLRRWRFHAPGTPPKGLHVDGAMDPEERAWDADGEWFVLARRGEALMFVVRMSENLAREIRLHVVYRDDAEHGAPPEAVPGSVPLVGFEGRNVERLPGDRYRFELSVLTLSHYRPGEERHVLASVDDPLTADVTAMGPGPTVPAAPAAAREAPP
jgi:hypothetical protein